jgi:hypothetical protein
MGEVRPRSCTGLACIHKHTPRYHGSAMKAATARAYARLGSLQVHPFPSPPLTSVLHRNMLERLCASLAAREKRRECVKAVVTRVREGYSVVCDNDNDSAKKKRAKCIIHVYNL